MIRRFFSMSKRGRLRVGSIRSCSQADLGVADVHVLDADRAAVGLAQDRDQLAKGRRPPALSVSRL